VEFASSFVLPALRALSRNKMRSALTMLGVVIGVAAVIATVSIGQGAGRQMQDSIASLGSNMLMVFPGSLNRNGAQLGMGQIKSLQYDDAKAIARECPMLEAVAAGVQTSTQIVYGTDNWFTQVIGTEPPYFGIRSWVFADGAPFTEEDVEKANDVAVIGDTVRRELFGAINPIGQIIRVKKLPFRVVGLLASKGGSNFGQDQDDMVVIPLTTAQKKVVGITWLNWIFVSAVSQAGSYRAQDEIKAIMRDRHRIAPGANDDFVVRSMAEFEDFASRMGTILALLLGSIACVSLIVGGIGIMNIMLVSVTERTREIGIRVAIGATEQDVQRQFLVEAVMLSLTGGIVGILLGELASMGISRALGWSFGLSVLALTVAVLFSAAVGISFGFYPARRASRLNPIDALRYE
jgi:putative ABC transport system permease protein